MDLTNINNLGFISVILVSIACVLFFNLPGEKIQTVFLNIGQGDSIYLRTPDDYQILIDGGPLSIVIEEIGEIMPLYNKTFDLLVITHPHADHFEGLIEVIHRFDVEKIMLVGTPTYNRAYEVLLEAAIENNIEVIYANSVKDLKIGSWLYFDVIFPDKGMVGKEVENKNNASIVIRALMEKEVVLFTGDAEHEEENEILLNGYSIKTDVLKSGHHGSKTASGDEFLKAARPEKVVIQCGIDNQFNHPHKEALDRYAKAGVVDIYRTDLLGRIEL